MMNDTSLKRTIYWHETETVTPGPALTDDISGDVCLIGGGYTSLWTSIFLKKADPTIDVHIFESQYVGAGASGHNDGFVTPTIGHSLSTVVAQFGIEASKEAYIALGRSILELNRFCQTNNVDAELEPNGFCLVATTEHQKKRLEHDVELSEQFGGRMKLRLLESNDIRSRVPSPIVRAGIASGGALINPFKLARGLAAAAVAQGVHIHEQTPVTSVKAAGSRQHLVTPYARATADHVVFATNAYQWFFPDFRNHTFPVWSYALVSDPLTDEQLERSGWVTREGFVEAKNFVVFGRLTKDNRILFGGGPVTYFLRERMNERAHLQNDRVESILRAQFKRFLPQLSDIHWSHFYGGPVAMTRRLVPQIGTLRPGWHFAHGFCGNGISSTHLAGKVLSDLILGKETKYSNLCLVRKDHPRMPPEPLTYLGVTAAAFALEVQDRFPQLVPWPRL